MDTRGLEFNFKLYSHELERCEEDGKSSGPTDFTSKIGNIKEALSSLKTETKKIVSAYGKKNMVERAKEFVTDFRSKYRSARETVQVENEKLFDLGLEKQSSVGSCSYDDFEFRQGLTISSKPDFLSSSAENPITDLLMPSTPNLQRSLRPLAPTRLTFELKENEARDEVMQTLRTPQGLSIDSSLNIQDYIRDIKSKFLIYKEIFLEFKDWLLTHGSVNERNILQQRYELVMPECNHLIRGLNKILEDRREETGSTLGSLIVPALPGDQARGSVLLDPEDCEFVEGVERQQRSALLEDIPLLASTNIGVIREGRTPCVPSDRSGKPSFLDRQPPKVEDSGNPSLGRQPVFTRSQSPQLRMNGYAQTTAGREDPFGTGNHISVAGHSNRNAGKQFMPSSVHERELRDVSSPRRRRYCFGGEEVKPNQDTSSKSVYWFDSIANQTAKSPSRYAPNEQIFHSFGVHDGGVHVSGRYAAASSDTVLNHVRSRYDEKPVGRGFDSLRSANGVCKNPIIGQPSPQNYHSGNINMYVDGVVRSHVRSDLYRGMMEPFDGSPERFWSWKTQLQSHLREASCSAIDTVHIMLKNTTGKPKAIVQDYSDNCCDNPESTLDEVWRELEKRFGSNLLVSRSLLDKLHSFSGVDDPHDIDQMEKLLAICRSARSRMGTCKKLRVLNYQSELRQIWEKMPAQFQQKWQTKYMRIEKSTGQSPNLNHLF